MFRCLDYLDQLEECSLSFQLFAISDSSCIDLATLERVSLQDIVHLVNSDFEHMNEGCVDDIRGVLANGYTLPSIMIIKVKGNNNLVANLLVADICQGGVMERSTRLIETNGTCHGSIKCIPE